MVVAECLNRVVVNEDLRQHLIKLIGFIFYLGDCKVVPNEVGDEVNVFDTVVSRTGLAVNRQVIEGLQNVFFNHELPELTKAVFVGF